LWCLSRLEFFDDAIIKNANIPLWAFVYFSMKSDLGSNAGIPNQVWLIGIASLLITASAAMSFSVFGLFLRDMGVSFASIGIIDGVMEGISYCVKLISGVASDYFRKKKVVFAIGAFIIAVPKVFVAAFLYTKVAVIGRMMDRLGNGIQATPRDALISCYAQEKTRGTCFGIRQGLGVLGSVLGTIVVSLLLKRWGLRTVFIVASIPATLAFFFITFFVKDQAQGSKRSKLRSSADVTAAEQKQDKFHIEHVFALGREYWKLMLVVAVFTAGRFSETFIILYGQDVFSLSKDNAVHTMIVYNIAAAVASYFAGRFTDRFSAKKVMITGMLILACANIVIFSSAAKTATYYQFIFGVILWGFQISIMQTSFSADIAAAVPIHMRGTGFGIFYLTTAISLLLANAVAGRLMNSSGRNAFLYGAAVTIIACIITVFLGKNRKVSTQVTTK
jgi:MFS family permease